MRFARFCGAVALGLLAAACASHTDDGTDATTPDATSTGREAIYADLARGDIATADAILDDTWPGGVKLAWPLTWEDAALQDSTFRTMFYSLRFTEHLRYAYEKTGDRKYTDKLFAILRSYARNEPKRAYDATTFDDKETTAYRLMVLTHLYGSLSKTRVFQKDIGEGIHDTVARGMAFLADSAHFDATSAKGFTEAAALLVAADNFPDLDANGAWRKTALDRLELLRTQKIAADGVDFDGTPVATLGVVSQIARWMDQYELAAAPAWDATRSAMTRYLAYLTQPNGRLPALDAMGNAAIPSQDALVFGPLADVDPAFAWVWSGGTKGSAPEKRVALFPTAGLYVLRADNASAAQTYATLDATTHAVARSHRDALSTTIYSEGAALLPDAGLFTNDAGEAYDYFHGTRSHNTVTVDGQDQKAGTATPGAFGVTGNASWATASSALYDGVVHKRTVVVLDQGVVLVTDDLSSDTAHDYRQTWHFFAGGELTMDGLAGTLDNVKGTPILRLGQADPSGLSVSDMVGQAEPLQGWVSASYGKKDAAHALEYLRHGTTASFATAFATGSRARAGTPVKVQQTHDGGDRVVTVCAEQENATVRIHNEGAADAQVTVTGGGC